MTASRCRDFDPYTLQDIQEPFPRGYYYAGPRAFEGTEKAFVKYPPNLPFKVKDRMRIPGNPWLILAYERNGLPLEPSAYEKGTERLAGVGARGACVIRVNPMPEGSEEFDWKNGWSLIGEKRVVIYGRGVR